MRASILGALVLLAAAAPGARAGSLVDVTVEVGGLPVPLYDAVDGSGRLYFEAREGCPYALRVQNRSPERLGALVIVDGLNVISGAREETGGGRPGRMYVLGPWEGVDVRGWRTSLEQVRQFTFVDERGSYAARVGKANRHMGWVEVAIYRDRYPQVGRWRREQPMTGDESDRRDRADSGAGAAEAPAPSAKSYPGTGWGDAAWDPATEVRFDAADYPAERITLRYEYARSLQALGILPRPRPHRDRLGERERGDGFAPAPRW